MLQELRVRVCTGRRCSVHGDNTPVPIREEQKACQTARTRTMRAGAAAPAIRGEVRPL